MHITTQLLLMHPINQLLHLAPYNYALICSRSSDVSHLTMTQPLPFTTAQPATTDPADLCLNVNCQNDGVCIVDEGKAACRWAFLDLRYVRALKVMCRSQFADGYSAEMHSKGHPESWWLRSVCQCSCVTMWKGSSLNYSLKSYVGFIT